MSWAAPVSGDFVDPLRWSPQVAPADNDTATINAAGNYTVTLSQDRKLTSLTVDAGSNTTFLLTSTSDGATSLTSAVDVVSGNMTMTSTGAANNTKYHGTLFVDALGRFGTSAGAGGIRDIEALLYNHGTVTLATDTLFTTPDGGFVVPDPDNFVTTIPATFYNFGATYVQSGTTLVDTAAFESESGTFVIENGANFILTNSFAFIKGGAISGDVTLGHGSEIAFNVDQPAARFVVTDNTRFIQNLPKTTFLIQASAGGEASLTFDPTLGGDHNFIGTFSNSGTIRFEPETGGTSKLDFNQGPILSTPIMYNNGTIIVQGASGGSALFDNFRGSLNNGSPTTAGTITVNNDFVLDSAITNYGLINLQSHTTTVMGSFTMAGGTLQFSGGTLLANGFAYNGGVIQGGSVNLAGTLSFAVADGANTQFNFLHQYGSLQSNIPSHTTITATSTADDPIVKVSLADAVASVTNNGNLFLSTSLGATSTTLSVAANKTFTNNGVLSVNSTGGEGIEVMEGAFINNALFISGAGTATIQNGVFQNNADVFAQASTIININAATFEQHAGSLELGSAARMKISNGGIFVLSGGSISSGPGARIELDGTSRLQTPVANVGAATFLFAGGGYLDTNLPTGATLIENSGAVVTPNHFINNGTIQLSPLSVDASAAFTILGDSPNGPAGTMTNSGTIVLQGNSSISGYVLNNGTILNNASNATVSDGSVTNNGYLRLNDNSYTLIRGDLNLSSGTLVLGENALIDIQDQSGFKVNVTGGKISMAPTAAIRASAATTLHLPVLDIGTANFYTYDGVTIDTDIPIGANIFVSPANNAHRFLYLETGKTNHGLITSLPFEGADSGVDFLVYDPATGQGAGTFTNVGTIDLTDADAGRTFQGSLVNTGTFLVHGKSSDGVNPDAYNYGVFTNSGTLSIATNAMLRVDGSTYNQTGGQLLLSPGAIMEMGNDQRFSVTGGTINGAAGSTIILHAGTTLHLDVANIGNAIFRTADGMTIDSDMPIGADFGVVGTGHHNYGVTFYSGKTNHGRITLLPPASGAGSGNFIQIYNPASDANDGTFTNAGTLEFDASTDDVSEKSFVGNLVNTGTTLFNAPLNLTFSGSISNSGFFAVGAGSQFINRVPFVQSGGTLQVGANAQLQLKTQQDVGTLLMTGGTLNVLDNGSIFSDSDNPGFTYTGGTINLAGSLTTNQPIDILASGKLTVSGVHGVLTAGGDVGATGGTIQLSGGTILAASTGYIHSGGLVSGNGTFSSTVFDIDGTSTARATGGALYLTGLVNSSGHIVVDPAATLVLKSVASAIPGGSLTLNGSAILDYNNTASPKSAVRAALSTGRANGTWNGAGINSTNAGGNNKLAVGYAEAAALGVASFSGQNVDTTALLLRLTYSGDANLDGRVNTLDFNTLATHFNGTDQYWTDGDFNYDGKVNALDFNSIATNFGAPVIAPSPALGSLVPEPNTIFAIALMGSASRCRRRAIGSAR